MPASSLVLALVLVSPAPAWRDSPEFWIDPVHGIDAVGRGNGPQNAVRSITFALTQGAQGSVHLAPGEYSEASGEHFPIVISSEWFWAIGSREVGVRICGSSDPDVPVFVVPFTNEHWFKNLEVVAAGPAFVVNMTWQGLLLESVEVRAGRAIDAFYPEGAEPTQIWILNSDLETRESAITLRGALPDPGLSVVDIRSSRLHAGPRSAIVDVQAEGQGDLRVRLSTSVLHASGAGLRLPPGHPLGMEAEVRSCAFWDLGAPGLDGGPIAIEGASLLAVSVERSIFWGNHDASDLPGYDPATYSLSTNLFEDPALAALPGSLGGDPRFVDPERGDFHLRPDSPARDAATAAVSEFDLEGDPRGPVGGPVDLGPDEFFDHYHWFWPRPRLGRTTTLRVLGHPGDLAFAFAVPQRGLLPHFDAGWQLGRPATRPFVVTLIGPDGLAEIPMRVPSSDLRLVPPTLLSQVAYLTSGGELEASVNVQVVTLTR